MANTVKFGLSNVHVAFATETGWGTPTAIPGAVNLTLDAAGDESEFYADNKKYFVQHKNNGYSGTMETALFPDSVLAEMLGWYTDTNGNIVEDADGHPKKFALSCQVEGDDKARRIVWYECQVSRPSTDAATTESSIAPKTDTVNITIVPHTFSSISKNVVKLVCYEGDAKYANFFTAVVEPAAAAE